MFMSEHRAQQLIDKHPEVGHAAAALPGMLHAACMYMSLVQSTRACTVRVSQHGCSLQVSKCSPADVQHVTCAYVTCCCLRALLLSQVVDIPLANVAQRLLLLKQLLPQCDVARMIELQPRWACSHTMQRQLIAETRIAHCRYNAIKRSTYMFRWGPATMAEHA
jgi:hypothetical protein